MNRYVAALWYRTPNHEVWHAFETWRRPGSGVARHISLCGKEGKTIAVLASDGCWHCQECTRRLQDRKGMME